MTMNTLPLPEIKQLVATELYINGQFQPGSGTNAISVTNPFDNEEICRVAPASEAQVQNAIEAAATALKSPAEAWPISPTRHASEATRQCSRFVMPDVLGSRVQDSDNRGFRQC